MTMGDKLKQFIRAMRRTETPAQHLPLPGDPLLHVFCTCSPQLSMCGVYVEPSRFVEVTRQVEIGETCPDCHRIHSAACVYCGCTDEQECTDLCKRLRRAKK